MKLKSLPKIERPREKLIQKGPQNLKDEEKGAAWKAVFKLNFPQIRVIVKEGKKNIKELDRLTSFW